MFTVPIDEAKLLEIVRRLVEGVKPDRIILCGSRARGDAGLDSDLERPIHAKTGLPCRN